MDDTVGHPRHEYSPIGESGDIQENLVEATRQTAPFQQQQQGEDEERDHQQHDPDSGRLSAKRIEHHFRWMSVLFGANHASVVSCLSLATARFAAVGAWQSGILYTTYVASALLGATGVVKHLGGRNALVAGMGLYCAYVAAFLLATLVSNVTHQQTAAYVGAAIGGVGAGFLWTAQGKTNMSLCVFVCIPGSFRVVTVAVVCHLATCGKDTLTHLVSFAVVITVCCCCCLLLLYNV